MLLRCMLVGTTFVLGGLSSMSFADPSGVTPSEARQYFQDRGKKVVTFVGFSGSGYEDTDRLKQIIRQVLSTRSPETTIVNAGATVDGIGAVYEIAKDMGFKTAGIVSIQAKKEEAEISKHCDKVFFIEDASWGGLTADGKTLSSTSRAMVDCSDVVIGIGGGEVARVELLEAKRLGKKVDYFTADMNHQRAIDKARKKGQSPPTDFKGSADQALGDD